jgi:hypothetical protein
MQLKHNHFHNKFVGVFGDYQLSIGSKIALTAFLNIVTLKTRLMQSHSPAAFAVLHIRASLSAPMTRRRHPS